MLVAGSTAATVATTRAEDNPCGNAPGDVVVRVGSATRYLTIIVANTASTTMMGGTLPSGQTVDV